MTRLRRGSARPRVGDIHTCLVCQRTSKDVSGEAPCNHFLSCWRAPFTARPSAMFTFLAHAITSLKNNAAIYGEVGNCPKWPFGAQPT